MKLNNVQWLKSDSMGKQLKTHQRGRTTHNISMFDLLRNNYGISKTWVATRLGMSKQAFEYALFERGLTESEVQKIEAAIKMTAKDLLAFKVPENFKQKKAA